MGGFTADRSRGLYWVNEFDTAEKRMYFTGGARFVNSGKLGVTRFSHDLEVYLMRWWPRTVRWQLIFWLMLLEALSVALFAIVLVKIEGREIRRRALERLAHQATSVALQAEEAYRQQHPELVLSSLRMMGEAPSVAHAKITDAAGNVLFVSQGEPANSQLDPAEKSADRAGVKH